MTSLKDGPVEKGFNLFCNGRGRNYGRRAEAGSKEEGFSSVGEDVLVVRAAPEAHGLF